jgi:HTH-type transcriptional regulator/antitoxin HigA
MTPSPITRPLRTAREYRAAVHEIDELLDARHSSGSAGDDRLALLSVLVEAYEADRGIDLEDPTPQEAVDFMLEMRGLTRAALAPHMGGRSRVSDFFSGRRALSTAQVIALRALLGVPADLLIPRRAPRPRDRVA